MGQYIILQELTGVGIENKKLDSLTIFFFQIAMDDEKIHIS